MTVLMEQPGGELVCTEPGCHGAIVTDPQAHAADVHGDVAWVVPIPDTPSVRGRLRWWIELPADDAPPVVHVKIRDDLHLVDIPIDRAWFDGSWRVTDALAREWFIDAVAGLYRRTTRPRRDYHPSDG